MLRWYALGFLAVTLATASNEQPYAPMAKRDGAQVTSITAAPRMETRLPRRRSETAHATTSITAEAIEEDDDIDNKELEKRGRYVDCDSTCDTCCEAKSNAGQKKNKKKKGKGKKKKGNLYNAIARRRVVPYVRFQIHESMNLPGEYDPRQLDIRFCGEAPLDNNWIQWHSQKVAADINQGAVIKCQTFILRDVRKNTASVGVFDKTSKIIWDSDPFQGKYTPRLITSGPPASALSQRYEFDCKKYDYTYPETGIYFYGWRCKIISRDQGRRKTCLFPLEFVPFGGGLNDKGNLTAIPCPVDKEDEDDLMYWDLLSVADDFTNPDMQAVTVDTPIQSVPAIPKSVPYNGEYGQYGPYGEPAYGQADQNGQYGRYADSSNALTAAIV